MRFFRFKKSSAEKAANIKALDAKAEGVTQVKTEDIVQPTAKSGTKASYSPIRSVPAEKVNALSIDADANDVLESEDLVVQPSLSTGYPVVVAQPEDKEISEVTKGALDESVEKPVDCVSGSGPVETVEDDIQVEENTVKETAKAENNDVVDEATQNEQETQNDAENEEAEINNIGEAEKEDENTQNERDQEIMQESLIKSEKEEDVTVVLNENPNTSTLVAEDEVPIAALINEEIDQEISAEAVGESEISKETTDDTSLLIDEAKDTFAVVEEGNNIPCNFYVPGITFGNIKTELPGTMFGQFAPINLQLPEKMRLSNVITPNRMISCPNLVSGFQPVETPLQKPRIRTLEDDDSDDEEKGLKEPEVLPSPMLRQKEPIFSSANKLKGGLQSLQPIRLPSMNLPQLNGLSMMRFPTPVGMTAFQPQSAGALLPTCTLPGLGHQPRTTLSSQHLQELPESRFLENHTEDVVVDHQSEECVEENEEHVLLSAVHPPLEEVVEGEHQTEEESHESVINCGTNDVADSTTTSTTRPAMMTLRDYGEAEIVEAASVEAVLCCTEQHSKASSAESALTDV